MDINGPGRFSERKLHNVEWVTDYQLDRPDDLLRLEVRQEPVDDQGMEHLRVVVDRRIVGEDFMPVEDFLGRAHTDLMDAFQSLLEPSYLDHPKHGK